MLTSGGSSSKKIRKKPSFRKRYHGFKKNLVRAFLVLCVLVILSVGIYWLLQYILYDDRDLITNVEINPDSLAYVSTGSWYTETSASLIGTYDKPMRRRNWKNIKRDTMDTYPLLQDIDLSTDQKTAYLNFVYEAPYFVISDYTQQYHRVVWENELSPVQADDLIVQQAQRLLLPDYLEYTTTDQIEGMFYQIHSDTLQQIVQKILDILYIGDITSITFMPGGEKLMIEYLNKTLIFHLDKSIDAQLAKIVDISNFFDQYESVQRIDLGSSDDIIVK